MTSPVGDNIVGSAGISVSPEIDKSGLAKFKSQLRAATSSAAKGANASLRQEMGKLPTWDHVTKGMVKAQKDLRKTTRVYQAESNAWASLQRQRATVVKATNDKVVRSMAEFSRDYDAKIKANREATIAGNRAAADFTREMDQLFNKSVKAGTGLDQVRSRMQSVSSSIHSGGGFLDGLYKAGSAISQLATRVGMLGYQMQLLGRMSTTAITFPIVGSIGVATAVGIKQAAAIERAMKGMVALKPNENILPFFKAMMDFAEKSPVFETGPLLDSIRNLAAAGMETKKIDELVRSMGNIGMTLGVDGQSMSRAFYAFSQIASKGRLYAEELNQQLGDAIPGIKQMLAEGLGITQEELQIRLKPSSPFDKKGTKAGPPIMADEFFEAMRKAGQLGKYAEGGASGALSLNAAWQSLIETAKNSLGKQFLTEGLMVKPEITKGLQELGKAVKLLIEEAGRAGVFEGVISAFVKFVGLITSLVEKYQSLNQSQKDLIPKFALLAAAIGPVMMAVAPLFSVMGMFANTMATVGIAIGGIATPAGAAALAILAATAALTALGAVLYTKVEPFRKKLNQGLIETARLFDEHVMPAVNDLWTELTILGRELNSLGIDWGTLATLVTGYLKGLVFGAAALIRTFQGGVRVVKFFAKVSATAFGAFLIPVRIATDLLLKFTRVLEKIPHFGGGFSDFRGDLESFQGGLEGVNKKLFDFGTENGRVEGTTFSLTSALGGLGNMFGENASKAHSLSDAVDDLREKLLGAKDAASENVDAGDAFRNSQLDLKDAITRNRQTLSDQTRAGLANRNALKLATQASVEKTLADIKSGVPMAQAIAKHRERIAALKGEFTKSKEVKEEAGRLIKTYDKIPSDVKTMLQMLGYKDVGMKLLEMSVRQRALREGKSFDTLWAKEKKLERMNKKGWSSGGWTGPGGRLQPAGIVHRDEHVIKQTSRRRIEKTNPGLLDYINRRGMLPPQYAGGGRVENWPFPIDVSKTMVKDSWGLPTTAGLVGSGGSGGPGRYQQMFAWIHKMMGGQVHLTSGYRPGDPLLHGQGRAVDLTFPDGSERTGGGLAQKAFNLIKSHFFKSITELIWDFAGNQAVWNGQNHFFTGPGAGPGTHNDHIHWSHDNGGPFYDGMLTRNLSGQTETVLNSAQGKAFEERIRGAGSEPEVHVYIGDQELKAVVRVVVKDEKNKTVNALKRGRG